MVGSERSLASCFHKLKDFISRSGIRQPLLVEECLVTCFSVLPFFFCLDCKLFVANSEARSAGQSQASPRVS